LQHRRQGTTLEQYVGVAGATGVVPNGPIRHRLALPSDWTGPGCGRRARGREVGADPQRDSWCVRSARRPASAMPGRGSGGGPSDRHDQRP
jgi:hypothetical protein